LRGDKTAHIVKPHTLILCRLSKGEHKALPAWKGQNYNTKHSAILKTLQDTTYDKAEICITAQLSTIIHKKWLSDQPVVEMSTSSKVLYPFSVPELPEDLIDDMSKKVESLHAAKSMIAK